LSESDVDFIFLTVIVFIAFYGVVYLAIRFRRRIRRKIYDTYRRIRFRRSRRR
jgi:hypothetical protein